MRIRIPAEPPPSLTVSVSAIALTPSLRLALLDATPGTAGSCAARRHPSDVLGLAIFFLCLAAYLLMG